MHGLLVRSSPATIPEPHLYLSDTKWGGKIAPFWEEGVKVVMSSSSFRRTGTFSCAGSLFQWDLCCFFFVSWFCGLSAYLVSKLLVLMLWCSRFLAGAWELFLKLDTWSLEGHQSAAVCGIQNCLHLLQLTVKDSKNVALGLLFRNLGGVQFCFIRFIFHKKWEGACLRALCLVFKPPTACNWAAVGAPRKTWFLSAGTNCRACTDCFSWLQCKCIVSL